LDTELGFFGKLLLALVSHMKNIFPELNEMKRDIKKVIENEGSELLIKFNPKWIHLQDDCQCQISELIQGQATKIDNILENFIIKYDQEGLLIHSEKSRLLERSELIIKGVESKINVLIEIIEYP
jgi:Ni,Fe-hydrogenase I small subunit